MLSKLHLYEIRKQAKLICGRKNNISGWLWETGVGAGIDLEGAWRELSGVMVMSLSWLRFGLLQGMPLLKLSKYTPKMSAFHFMQILSKKTINKYWTLVNEVFQGKYPKVQHFVFEGHQKKIERIYGLRNGLRGR